MCRPIRFVLPSLMAGAVFLGSIVASAALHAQESAADFDRYVIRIEPSLLRVAPGGSAPLSMSLRYRGREKTVTSFEDFDFQAEAGLFKDNVYFAPQKPGIYRFTVRYKLQTLDEAAVGFVRVEGRALEPGAATSGASAITDTPRGETLRLLPELVQARPGNSVAFRVETVRGVPMAGGLFAWECGTLGSIAEDGWFTAGKDAGEGLVRAVADDGRVATARVKIVRYAPARIEIESAANAVIPDTPTLLRASAIDSLGGRARLAPRWAVSAGKIADNGVLTVPVGVERVVVVAVDPDSGLRGVRILPVCALLPVSLEIHPGLVSAAEGERLYFHAVGHSAAGEIGDVAVSWHVTAGSVDTHGAVTVPAKAQGPIFVVARSDTFNLTAIAEIRPESAGPPPVMPPRPAATAPRSALTVEPGLPAPATSPTPEIPDRSPPQPAAAPIPATAAPATPAPTSDNPAEPAPAPEPAPEPTREPQTEPAPEPDPEAEPTPEPPTKK